MLDSISRRAKLHPQKQRSKYICKPEAVVEAGNHFVWEFVPGKGSLNVPADAAILHHYRVNTAQIASSTTGHWNKKNDNLWFQVCEFGGDDCIKTPSLVDRSAHKYTTRLVKRIDTIYNELKGICNLPNITAVPPRSAPARIPKNITKQIKLPVRSVTVNHSLSQKKTFITKSWNIS